MVDTKSSSAASSGLPYDPSTIRNEPDTEIALSVDNYFGNGDTFKKLQEAQNNDKIDTKEYYNYILKCTDGMFKGRYFYINTTPDGESFGSGDVD